MTKSVVNALTGILVRKGKLAIHDQSTSGKGKVIRVGTADRIANDPSDDIRISAGIVPSFIGLCLQRLIGRKSPHITNPKQHENHILQGIFIILDKFEAARHP